MDPITIGLICAGVGALLSGGGTAVYLNNEHQKEVKALQGQIARLQKQVHALQSQIVAKQRSLADLQTRLAEREQRIAELLKERIDVQATIVVLQERIEKNSRFWAKVVAALTFRLKKLEEETEAMKDELAEAENREVQAQQRVQELEAERARLEASVAAAEHKVANMELELRRVVAKRAKRAASLQALSA
jgi:chromosome segregation ATPase